MIPYPTQLATITGLPVVNRARSGTFLETSIGGSSPHLDADYPTNVAPYFSATTANILIVEGGINDIYNGGTAAGMDTAIRSYCAQARVTGFMVYVQTIAASNGYGWSSPQETIRQAVNTDRRANWASYCDGLIDVDANAAFSNPANTTYFQSDQLHWTTAANTVVANLVKTGFGL